VLPVVLEHAVKPSDIKMLCSLLRVSASTADAVFASRFEPTVVCDWGRQRLNYSHLSKWLKLYPRFVTRFTFINHSTSPKDGSQFAETQVSDAIQGCAAAGHHLQLQHLQWDKLKTTAPPSHLVRCSPSPPSASRAFCART
jgi:hypothetical protein